MKKEVFRSRIDWWVWCVVVFFFTILIVAGIGGMGWITFWIYLIGFGSIFLVILFGTWYAIEGDSLLVYQFCCPHCFPIKKIKSIQPIKSILASAALSTKRIAIRFTDRSVLRSSMPLEISPKNKEAFVKRLMEINPDIQLL